MCVAVFKPAGASTPTLETLKKCWDANKDGAGVSISEKRCVYVKKGFMSFTAFEKFYKERGLAGLIDRAIVFHFRISTHGLADGGNTHPFPVSDKPEVLRATEGRYPLSVAHNGIFSNKIDIPHISDTGQFLADCHKDGGDPIEFWKKNPHIVGWSKLVVLRPGNRYNLLGDWKCDVSSGGGCFYSNLGWQSAFNGSDYWDDAWGVQGSQKAVRSPLRGLELAEKGRDNRRWTPKSPRRSALDPRVADTLRKSDDPYHRRCADLFGDYDAGRATVGMVLELCDEGWGDCLDEADDGFIAAAGRASVCELAELIEYGFDPERSLKASMGDDSWAADKDVHRMLDAAYAMSEVGGYAGGAHAGGAHAGGAHAGGDDSWEDPFYVDAEGDSLKAARGSDAASERAVAVNAEDTFSGGVSVKPETAGEPAASPEDWRTRWDRWRKEKYGRESVKREGC